MALATSSLPTPLSSQDKNGCSRPCHLFNEVIYLAHPLRVADDIGWVEPFLEFILKTPIFIEQRNSVDILQEVDLHGLCHHGGDHADQFDIKIQQCIVVIFRSALIVPRTLCPRTIGTQRKENWLSSTRFGSVFDLKTLVRSRPRDDHCFSAFHYLARDTFAEAVDAAGFFLFRQPPNFRVYRCCRSYGHKG